MTDPKPTTPRLDIKVGDWVVTGPETFGGLCGPVEGVTAEQFRVGWSPRLKQSALFVGSEDAARRLHNKLKSMQDDHERRQREAEQRYQDAMRRACKEAQDGQ